MGKTALWILVIICAIALINTSVWRGDLATGWGYETFWITFVRMMFPFFAGLLLFRMGKLIHIPRAYAVCSLLLIVLFSLPTFSYSGWYDAACIIVAFPIIVAAGAGGTINGRWAKLCRFAGAISYPIYIVHYPFIYIYTMWVASKKPAPSQIVQIAAFLFVFFMLLASAMLKFYDEPVRAWLKRKWLN
jgi:peptidoglycan/LPS O-acetylase OafA/YrhL